MGDELIPPEIPLSQSSQLLPLLLMRGLEMFYESQVPAIVNTVMALAELEGSGHQKYFKLRDFGNLHQFLQLTNTEIDPTISFTMGFYAQDKQKPAFAVTFAATPDSAFLVARNKDDLHKNPTYRIIEHLLANRPQTTEHPVATENLWVPAQAGEPWEWKGDNATLYFLFPTIFPHFK